MVEQGDDPWKAVREAINESVSECEDAPTERNGDGWSGVIHGFCPVQGHGELDGLFWYFRARHDEWGFEVHETSCAGELPPDEHMVWGCAGEDDDASWMKYSEAWRLIERSIAEFRETRPLKTL